MHQVIVEPALGQKLGEVEGQIVLCDADGHALGFFSPLKERARIEDLKLDPPLSIAETEELRKIRTGRLLNEVLLSLGIGQHHDSTP